MEEDEEGGGAALERGFVVGGVGKVQVVTRDHFPGFSGVVVAWRDCRWWMYGSDLSSSI